MKRFGILLALALGFAGAAQAQDDVGTTVLSPDDVRAYTQIFAAQKASEIAKADGLIRKLADPSLLGYVLQQRYLLPHGYKTKFAELKSWLENYADHVGADRVYKLAVKRAPKKTAVAQPIPIHWRGVYPEAEAIGDTAPESPAGVKAAAQFRALEHDGKPEAAAAALDGMNAGASLPQADIDRLGAYVAAAYLAEAKDKEAQTQAEAVLAHGPANAALCHWTAGLAAYRQGLFESAAQHFEAMAAVAPAKTGPGGYFWAARSWQSAGHPEKVTDLYARAAAMPNTFYGLLASRVLGKTSALALRDPTLDTLSFAQLMQNKPAHRAVALWQIGHRDEMEPELARAFGQTSPDLDPAFAALARSLGSPSLEIRAAETSAKSGIFLSSLYPIPPYEPKGGYSMDEAVILGFARQESRFQAAALSGSGARGVMQIMPATAVVITRDQSLAGSNIDRLNDPVYSLTLGQNYLTELLSRQNGNFFAMVASYNAGIGNMTRWMAPHEGNNDPLLFIESIPAPQTRDYVKRVMMNVWMYRQRLGQAQHGLDETAAGDWPTYVAAEKVSAIP